MSTFVIFGTFGRNTATQNAVFGEIYEGRIPNAKYLHSGPSNFVSQALRWLLLKLKLGKRPMQKIHQLWDLKYRKVSRLLVNSKDNYIIYAPGTHPFDFVSPDMLEKLRKNYPECPHIVYLIDGVDRIAQINRTSVDKLLDFFAKFDAVYTYDRTDSERYKLPFIEIPVWISKDVPAAVPEYELYFCGRNKSRSDLLMQIYDWVAAAGLKCNYRLTDCSEKNSREGVHICNWSPYQETVKEVLKSNCILEILAENNYGATLRYKEAVIYNKKLLTNNPDITSLPYYDARWMRYFEKAEDIDLDWVKRVEDVDYGYKGDFSAERFLETVVELSRSKES